MKQGEIWHANLNPAKGREQGGFRPVLIVSGNLLNRYLDIVIACPLTTQIKNYKGNVVLLPDHLNKLKKTSEILTFHIRSISKQRLVKKTGDVKPEELKSLIAGLNDILRY